MLGKLIKQELKATSKYLIPMFLILIVISLFNRVIISLDIFHGVLRVIPAFINTIYIISVISAVIISFASMVLRFYKNLMSDEGYLMFTLPVSPKQLLNSKLIVSTLWTIVSVLAVLLSLFIAFATPDRLQVLWQTIELNLAELKTSFGNGTILIIIEFILIMFIGVIQNFLMFYFAIALGQLFNGRRLIGSFVAYFGINTISSIIIFAILLIGGLIMRTSLDELEALPNIVFPASIIIAIVFNGLYYYGINYIFNKKLNLE